MQRLSEKKFAIIGVGKMGETLLKGLFDSQTLKKEQIIATARHAERLSEIQHRYQIVTSLNNCEAVQNADVVLLCIKPQATRDVLDELAETLQPTQLVISIVASVSTGFIEERLHNEVPVVRSMPNTPCLVGAGMSTICGGKYAMAEHLELTKNIFGHVGRTIMLDEKHFDAVTGLSASGPGFIYVVIEALAEGGVKVGLPRKVATELAAQACLGAAQMVIQTDEHPAVLKDAVTTPAGCTIDGILKLEEGGLRVTLIKTIVEATRRAKELIEEE